MRELIVCEDGGNVSVAWGKVFLQMLKQKGTEISPLIVTIRGFKNSVLEENPIVRDGLDNMLICANKSPCHTVANTIFPSSLWNEKLTRDVLYERYLKCWPRIRKCQANRNGTYFLRLINYDSDHGPINQLEHIIETWKRRNHRRSALQALIFDPRRDHRHNRILGFPCLDQVVFNPRGTNGRDGLVVNGFYANQYIFEKAYGNYLGLSRLGRFMAQEMGLQLIQVNCISSSADLGYFPKKLFREFERELKSTIGE
jgi:hypothetical protein